MFTKQSSPWRSQFVNLKGSWTPAGKLRASFNKFSALFVSFEPAKLIQIIGEPVCAPVAGTSLLWVSNTESDLFRHQATGAFSYLVAVNLPTNLPTDFKRTGMMMIAWGCAVWGTGWSYPPYVWYGGSIQRISGTHQHMASRPGSTPTPAPSGEVPLCMAHTAAQEASRRTTPARARTHAVAPSMGHTVRVRTKAIAQGRFGDRSRAGN